MEELLENWQSKMEFYRNEADNATTQINQVKATQKFYTYRDCIKELKQALILPVVSRTFKEKHLDTFDEFLLYHCEKQDDYQYVYKGYEYWKNNLHYIYEQLKNNQP
jgi:hypothetical protein